MMYAIAVGALFASGAYLVLSNHLLRLAIGLALLSQGANLLIFQASGLFRGSSPIIPSGQAAPTGVTEPTSQALILTAIVIGFAFMAFFVTLLRQTFVTFREADPDAVPELES